MKSIRAAGLFTLMMVSVSPSAWAADLLFLQGNDNTLDSSGNGNNGSFIVTTAYAPGIVGDGFSLTGTNYVDVPAGSGLNIPSGKQITFIADVNPTSGFTGSERIIDKITPGVDDGYLIDINNDQIRVIMAGDHLLGTDTITTGVFTEVKVVYDGELATPTLSLYQNGVLQFDAVAGPFLDTSHDLRIGADQNGGHLFHGIIDQVEISSAIPVAVPEPSSPALISVGIVGVALCRRQRRPRLTMKRQ